ncbi:MAG: hypothetical protein N4A49_04940 [Marinifilaceae bacterium]|jgi:hypothetical protein|nr:hypothetical protein [Marinifilaceae bacterium]
MQNDQVNQLQQNQHANNLNQGQVNENNLNQQANDPLEEAANHQPHQAPIIIV